MGREGSANVGVDVGATLAKIAVRNPAGELEFRFEPALALDSVAELVAERRPARLGLTGGGAAELARRIGGDTAVAVNEFAAWGAGAKALLEASGQAPGDRYLVISVGTGTSALLVDGMAVQRVGGTGLGGGTIVGLGALLLGTRSFGDLVALAAKGDRRNVDLLVSDIYRRAGEIPLAADLTAANFGKAAHAAAPADPADVAHAIMGLVGESISLICAGLRAALQVKHVVFGGSTLRENAPLTDVVAQILGFTGARPTFLANGEYAGALGALLLAES
jgi:type II pantothenate kinase